MVAREDDRLARYIRVADYALRSSGIFLLDGKGADGEFQAADKLKQAADIISTNPQALQLRFLGTLAEIATEKNSTIVFPLPIDMLKAFLTGNKME